GSFFLFQMAIIFAIIYFLMIRPKVKQERRHREQIAQLKKGDEVVTAGGVVGEVIHIKDDRVTIKSGESRFVVMRDKIADIPSMTAKEEKRA
ncbi:MAG: preprotein translocase subunit YajC, partial [Gemmatimonadales bacterium]